MQYAVKGTYKRHFELFSGDNHLLGKLDYKEWFSIKAELHIGESEVLAVGPVGFWQTAIEMKQGEEVLCKLKMNWKGQIVLDMANGTTYLYKREGLFSTHMKLVTEADHEIVSVHQHFNLSSFSFNYKMTTDDNYKPANDPRLLLLLVYATNYLHTMQSAAM